MLVEKVSFLHDKNRRIRSRAPLRVSFGGGGTDVSPFCDKFGGLVINATITKFVYCDLSFSSEKLATFINSDTEEFFELGEGALTSLNPRALEVPGGVRLHVATFLFITNMVGIELTQNIKCVTAADARNGSGLGTSSTCVVAMLRGYVELFSIGLDDHEIAEAAWRIERVDCGIMGGRQDQYAATFGGFNLLEFDSKGTTVIPLRIKNWIRNEFESHALLYFTGISRNSGELIANQIEAVGLDKRVVIENLKALKREAGEMKTALLRGDFPAIVGSMRRGWDTKMLAAPLSVSPRMREIHNQAIHAGAQAGKVCGAGGGGYMLFLVPPELKGRFGSLLEQFGGRVENCSFTDQGCVAWSL